MSASLAAARKRRIGNEQQNNVQNTQQVPQNNTRPVTGLTLPQVISVVDKRLIKLEEFMKQHSDSETISMDGSKISNDFNNVVEEFNERYSILAEEIDAMKDMMNSSNKTYENKSQSISNSLIQELNTKYTNLAQDVNSLKDMLMKLQSYTMEVNKTLMEERVRIFSDMENINATLDMKKPLNFDKMENIQGFSQKLDYLEQAGEFNIENEIANNQENLSM
jgi:hypothetical protein